MRPPLLTWLALAPLLAGAAARAAAQPVLMIPAPPASPTGSSVGFSDRFRADRLAAQRAFRPARPAVDRGGECVVRQMAGSTERLITGYFPSQADAEVMVVLTVDSTDRLLRYDEQRGVLKVDTQTPSGARISVDSALRAAEAATRSTSIWLDVRRNEAGAMNRGGGRPTEVVVGLVAGARAHRVARLPGAARGVRGRYVPGGALSRRGRAGAPRRLATPPAPRALRAGLPELMARHGHAVPRPVTAGVAGPPWNARRPESNPTSVRPGAAWVLALQATRCAGTGHHARRPPRTPPSSRPDRRAPEPERWTAREPFRRQRP
jgi:hypothetical protein